MFSRFSILLLITIFVTACGGGDVGVEPLPQATDDPVTDPQTTDNTVEINLIDDWQYSFSFENNICYTAITATGTFTVQSLNGDLSTIGNTLMQGEVIDFDAFGNCILTITDQVITDDYGRPAIQTESEFLAYLQEDAALAPEINEIVLEVFSETEIVIITNYTNGVVQRISFTRDLTI